MFATYTADLKQNEKNIFLTIVLWWILSNTVLLVCWVCCPRKYVLLVLHFLFSVIIRSWFYPVVQLCWSTLIIYPFLICSGCTFQCTPDKEDELQELQKLWKKINTKCFLLQVRHSLIQNYRVFTSSFAKGCQHVNCTGRVGKQMGGTCTA